MGRPGTGDRPDIGGPGDRPGRPGIGGPGDRPGRPDIGGPGDRPGRPDIGRPGRPGRPGGGNVIINRPQWNNQFNQINRHWHNRPNRPFHPGWWAGGPGVRPPIYHPWYRPGGWGRWHWWAGATVGALTGWFVGSAWSRPVYYNYGGGGNVYYESNTVYVDGSEYCSADEYYQQAEQIAESVPEYSEDQAEQLEWLPLGVWAVTQEGVTDSNRLIQLAVNKEGVIAGTYYNETTSSSIPIEGSVDQGNAACCVATARRKELQYRHGNGDL